MTVPEYTEKPMLPSWFISLVAAGLLIVIAVQGKAFLMPSGGCCSHFRPGCGCRGTHCSGHDTSGLPKTKES